MLHDEARKVVAENPDAEIDRLIDRFGTDALLARIRPRQAARKRGRPRGSFTTREIDRRLILAALALQCEWIHRYDGGRPPGQRELINAILNACWDNRKGLWDKSTCRALLLPDYLGSSPATVRRRVSSRPQMYLTVGPCQHWRAHEFILHDADRGLLWEHEALRPWPPSRTWCDLHRRRPELRLLPDTTETANT